ncbi:alpha/beta hydrolase [Luteimonas saliphila]|uniref:alpha/beta hydrolase n=1 Tax=Luteimonas saliphila TaxID=2804919 RepID=UPI00192D9457|nr:alpha/beta hydrolase [Luteimonas saliphila]
MLAPEGSTQSGRPAVVLFHGGGWSEGEASWMDAIAKQYATLGFVAVSVEYRLSRDGVTPFDAVADARNAIRWVRRNAARFAIDPEKVVALGTSAGAHLAASTTVFSEDSAGSHSSVPNALILRSPAVSVESSQWFQKLTGGSAQAAAISPTLHVRAGLPPMLLLQGAEDNITLASDARTFCERMHKQGNVCQLKIYPEVGHLFTRNLANREVPDYSSIDRAVSKDASQATMGFLMELGLIENAGAP